MGKLVSFAFLILVALTGLTGITGGLLGRASAPPMAGSDSSATQSARAGFSTSALASSSFDPCQLEVVFCEEFRIIVTAYSWTGYRMFNGEFPYKGAIAIKLPNKHGWKIGDKFLIQGREFIATDRLPSYQKADVDIYMTSKEEAKKWGRQELIIEKL